LSQSSKISDPKEMPCISGWRARVAHWLASVSVLSSNVAAATARPGEFRESKRIDLEALRHEGEAIAVGRQDPSADRVFDRVDQSAQARAPLRLVGVRPQHGRPDVPVAQGPLLKARYGEQRDGTLQRKSRFASPNEGRGHAEDLQFDCGRRGARRHRGVIAAHGSVAQGR
jgi:hypothetical protein